MNVSRPTAPNRRALSPADDPALRLHNGRLVPRTEQPAPGEPKREAADVGRVGHTTGHPDRPYRAEARHQLEHEPAAEHQVRRYGWKQDDPADPHQSPDPC